MKICKYSSKQEWNYASGGVSNSEKMQVSAYVSMREFDMSVLEASNLWQLALF